jgi:hypothetical protein
MSTPPDGTPRLAVRVARTVIDEIGQLPPKEAKAVQAAIRSIGSTAGQPIDIPGAPPGVTYLALAPDLRSAPIVIYRPLLPDEEGDWLVTALIDPDTYEHQREAERRGWLDDPLFRAAITGAAAADKRIRRVTGPSETPKPYHPRGDLYPVRRQMQVGPEFLAELLPSLVRKACNSLYKIPRS